MFSSQSKKTFSKRSGTKRVRRSRTACMARSAMGLTSMNHCVLRRGSTMSSLRWQRPMASSWSTSAARSPAASRSARMRSRQASRVSPAYGPACSFMVAASVMTSMRGRPWRSPVAKSVWSWAGVTFTAPVPKSRSTKASAMMGTSRSTKGMRTVRPTSAA